MKNDASQKIISNFRDLRVLSAHLATGSILVVELHLSLAHPFQLSSFEQLLQPRLATIPVR